MKLLFMFLFFTIKLAYSEVRYIDCHNSLPKGYTLEVEIDKFESLPPLSEIRLEQNDNLIAIERATKKKIILHTKPPQKAYRFYFHRNSFFKFLQINITKKYAHLFFKDRQIKFKECLFI